MTRRMWGVILLLLVGFFIIFLGALYYTTLQSERDYEERESETIINSAVESIEANVEHYKDISRLVMLNDPVTKYLKSEKVNASITNDARFGVMDVLNVMNNLDSVFIIRNDYSFMNTGKANYKIKYELMRSKEWLDVILEKKGGAVVIMNGYDAVHRSDGAPIITIGRAINDIYSQKQIGWMLLNFSTGMLDKIIQAQDSSEVCIIATDGTFLSGNKELTSYFSEAFLEEDIVHREIGSIFSPEMISAKKIKNMPFVIICKTSAGTGVVPRAAIVSFVVFMITFLISILVSASFMIGNLTSPILRLSDAMEKTQESGWLEKVDVEMPNNEIGRLADSYNSMIEYLNNLFNRLLENEKEMQKSEMLVLQEQIKPHFLYNSLECINCMAMDEGAENVRKAIETLGNFYRNSLSKGSGEIPLSREVQIIKDYLYLQRLRYGDMIQDEYDIDEHTEDIIVPRLMLQPLVENSIYHGIRLKGEDGVIRITSKVEDNKLVIDVRDTGVGMSEDKIAQMLSMDETEQSGTDGVLNGFGLKGTIKRVRIYCNNNDAVSIESEPGEFTNVRIVLPILRKELS